MNLVLFNGKTGPRQFYLVQFFIDSPTKLPVSHEVIAILFTLTFTVFVFKFESPCSPTHFSQHR